MAVLFPDKIKSNNPAAYGIVDANEIAGMRSIDSFDNLKKLSESIIVGDKDPIDAIGQIWNVKGTLYVLVKPYSKGDIYCWNKLNLETNVNNRNIVYLEVSSFITEPSTEFLNDTYSLYFDTYREQIFAISSITTQHHTNWPNKEFVVDENNKPLETVLYLQRNSGSDNSYSLGVWDKYQSEFMSIGTPKIITTDKLNEILV